MATYAEIKADAIEYADYRETNDRSRALKHHTAVTRLMMSPERISRGADGDLVEWDMETLREMLENVENWLDRDETATAKGKQLNGGYAVMSARRTLA